MYIYFREIREMDIKGGMLRYKLARQISSDRRGVDIDNFLKWEFELFDRTNAEM